MNRKWHTKVGMYEHHTSTLLPRNIFYKRLARHAAFGVTVIMVALGLGMIGYHTLEKMSWVDSFVNAAMILSGMGPLGSLNTDAGKIFAGCYALFSGLTLVAILGIIFAPVVHRFLHKFHLEDKELDKK